MSVNIIAHLIIDLIMFYFIIPVASKLLNTIDYDEANISLYDSCNDVSCFFCL
jgi:hypothetical protein